MDHPGAGYVDGAHPLQEAVIAPDPAGGHAVDDRVEKREQTVGLEVASANGTWSDKKKKDPRR